MLTFLAAGRKSEVYLAWDRRLRSTVAAKLPRPGRPVGKLRKEAALLERLAHPVLVRSFGAALDGPRPHLVLEHIAGPSVRALMRRGPISADIVAAVSLQVAGALHYLATEGLVHLDLKPHNILLASPAPPHALESGWRKGPAEHLERGPLAPRLIDAAAIQPVGSLAKALGGSVPELGAHGARAAPPAGVWLLGATMWRMLSGGAEVPGEHGGSRGRRGARSSHGSAREAYTLPASVPKPLMDLLLDCVRPHPSARPSAAEVADALEPLVAPRTTSGVAWPGWGVRGLRRWLAPSGGRYRGAPDESRTNRA